MSDSQWDRRSFLAASVALGSGLLWASAPAQATQRNRKSSRFQGGCACGCNQGPLTPTPLPVIPKAHTTVTQFSRSGSIGVGSASKLGPIAMAPVIWKNVTGTAKVFELDPVDSRNPAMACGVNDLGVSVGYSAGNPILWSADGSARPLPLGGASRGRALSVSNGGQLGGTLSQKGTSQGCIWNGNSVATLSMPGASDSLVSHVNSAGAACGAVLTDLWYPVVWQGTKGTVLSVPPLYLGGIAHFISEEGVVVGEVHRRRSRRARAAMWIDGTCVLVGPRAGRSLATGVSPDQRVIGDYVAVDGRRRGFVARETHWVELGSSAVLATGKAISSTGIVQGNSAVSGLAMPVKWTSPSLET